MRRTARRLLVLPGVLREHLVDSPPQQLGHPEQDDERTEQAQRGEGDDRTLDRLGPDGAVQVCQGDDTEPDSHAT